MAILMSYSPQFLGSCWICNAYKTRYMFEIYDKKTRSFLVLWSFSWAIAHYLGVPGRFTTTLRPDTSWRDMTQNSQFSRFIAVFHELLPIFLGSRRICMPRKNPYLFESYAQKLVVFVLMAILMSYWPHFWGSCWICKACKTSYIFEIYD